MWQRLTPREKEKIEKALTDGWPLAYQNSDTRKFYKPHHEAEARAVYDDEPRYVLVRGGEGGGKSCSGIIKSLNRIRRGMDGISVSPDFKHFSKSLWPEFRRWCPWGQVVQKQRYRAHFAWEPSSAFALSFLNGRTLYMGGIDEPGAWEGPNVNFAHFDEARRHNKPDALKVLDGRVRIPGPNGEPPQLFITTTPRKHWLYEYFGPILEDDPHADFKREMRDVILLTADNIENLEPDFVHKRALTLSAAEARVLLEAAWEDIEGATRFVDSMIWWDNCREELSFPKGQAMVLAADAGVTNDCFGVVGVTRHPDPKRRATDVAVRYVGVWKPKGGKPLDFGKPEAELRRLCKDFNVGELAYDPYQLHDMMTRFRRDRIVMCKEFSQAGKRLTADKQLRDLILRKGIAHEGDRNLWRHLDNADRKPDRESAKLRIVKREESLKVDLAVALSMASYECLRLNL